MKRLYSILLVLGMAFSLGACGVAARGQGTEPPGTNSGATVQTEQSAQKDSDSKQSPLEFRVQYIRTDGGPEGAVYPAVRVIPDRAALEAYYEENRQNYYLDRREQVYSDTSIGFLDACDKFDDSFFETGYLVFVLLEEGSGSVRHRVEGVSVDTEGRISLSVTTLVPEVGTDDMAQWHLILELDRGERIPEEKDLLLFLDGNLRWEGGKPVIPAKTPGYTTPPEGTLYTPDRTYPLRAAGYSWTYTQGENAVSAIADQAGRPPDRAYLEPVNLSSEYAETVYMPVQSGDGYEPTDEVGYLLKLDWQVYPDEITVTCWQEAVWDRKYVREERAAVWDVSAFYAKPGAYVYEIKATWEDRGEGYYGSANYYVNIRTPDHGHQLAGEPQTVKDPFVGYCGNTRTTLYVGDKTYTFMFGNSVTLTDILLNLDYKRGQTCRCMTEYTVDTEFGLGYEVNLTEGFARCEKGQASLTREQVEQIGEIIHWAVTTDCEYPVE